MPLVSSGASTEIIAAADRGNIGSVRLRYSLFGAVESCSVSNSQAVQAWTMHSISRHPCSIRVGQPPANRPSGPGLHTEIARYVGLIELRHLPHWLRLARSCRPCGRLESLHDRVKTPFRRCVWLHQGQGLPMSSSWSADIDHFAGATSKIRLIPSPLPSPTTEPCTGLCVT